MALLSTHELTAFYGDFQALFGIDTHVDEGETIAIIGSNGAGKSTYLRSITGLIRTRGESIRFDGRPIGGLPVTAIAKLGISLIPEGRRLFPSLSVQENLLIGRYGCNAPGTWSLDAIFALFPILAERRRAPSAALSGGQQQMVAIGRALISNPRLLLCDEISLGLAPVVINDIYNALSKIKTSGITVVLVEQDIVRALAAADRV
jgi:branched-chain amino acid transport system ATP-binding protein